MQPEFSDMTIIFRMKKADRIAVAEIESAVYKDAVSRRRGVDKSKLATIHESQEEVSQTQELMMDDEALLDEIDAHFDAVDVSDEEAFDERADELFVDRADEWLSDSGPTRFDQRTDAWHAQFGPKLYDLAVAKYLAKKDKLEKKSADDPSKTSQSRPTKKKKS